MTLPPCNGLQVLGPTDVDDGFKALHWFSDITYTDIWGRVTLLDSGLGDMSASVPFVLGFSEWVANPAYYGGWWRTGGIGFSPEAASIAAQSTNWNMSGLPESEHSGYSPAGVASPGVYDLNVKFVDVVSVGGVPTYSRFDTEVWHDDVLEWAQRLHCNFDPGQAPFTSISAIVINSRYAEDFPIYLDDISLGTGRGADDILPVVDFNDHTFGAFTVTDGTEDGSSTDPMVDSFSTTYDCAGGGGGGGAGPRFWADLV